MIAAAFWAAFKKKNNSRFVYAERFAEKYNTVLFWGIFLVCVLVRVVSYSHIPGGLNQDEASMGYDAYATAFYGIDRNGFHFPVYAVSWGSGQNTLMMYFTAVFVRLFGLSVFTVRLTSLIFGVITPVMVYLLAKRLSGGGAGKTNPLSALYIFLLISIAPWHIMLSRWALESNLLPAVFLIGVYLLVAAAQRKNTVFYCLSAGAFALSLYAYAAVCIVMPLFLLGALFRLRKKKLIGWRQSVGAVSVFIILAAPMILFFAVNLLGWDPIRTPFFSVPRLTAMRSAVSFGTAGQNLADLTRLLITQNDSLPWNSIGNFGIAYLFLTPFILPGIVSVIRHRKDYPYKPLMLWWFICAFVLGCLIHVNINRINLIFIPFIYLIGEGIFFSAQKIRFGGAAATVAAAAAFVLFCGTYFGKAYTAQIGKSFDASYGEAVKAAYADSGGTRTVYLTPANGAEAMALFYTEYDPRVYVNTVVYTDPNAEFRPVASFGNFKMGIPLEPDNTAIYVVENDQLYEFENEDFQITRFEYYAVAAGVG